MARKLIDLTGQRFGQLTVIERCGTYGDYEKDGHTCPLWLCRCDCGAEVKVPSMSLKTGNTKSCGCIRSDGQKRRRKIERMMTYGYAQ